MDYETITNEIVEEGIGLLSKTARAFSHSTHILRSAFVSFSRSLSL